MQPEPRQSVSALVPGAALPGKGPEARAAGGHRWDVPSEPQLQADLAEQWLRLHPRDPTALVRVAERGADPLPPPLVCSPAASLCRNQKKRG